MNIGIDIIEIERIEKIIKKNKFFLNKIFCNDEIEQILQKKNIFESAAARYCAKESFFKCIGTGIQKISNFKKIKILNNQYGKPEIFLLDNFKEKYQNFKFNLSMSHCKKYACAVVCENHE